MSQEMSAIAAINFSYYNPALAYTFATSSFSSNGGGGGCGTSTSPSSTSTSPLSTASSSSPCSSLPVSTNIHQHHHHQQHHHNTQQHQQLLSALSTAGASATSAAFNSPLINQNLISFPNVFGSSGCGGGGGGGELSSQLAASGFDPRYRPSIFSSPSMTVADTTSHLSGVGHAVTRIPSHNAAAAAAAAAAALATTINNANSLYLLASATSNSKPTSSSYLSQTHLNHHHHHQHPFHAPPSHHVTPSPLSAYMPQSSACHALLGATAANTSAFQSAFTARSYAPLPPAAAASVGLIGNGSGGGGGGTRKRRYKKPIELRRVLPKNSLMQLHELRLNVEYRFICQRGPIHRPLFTMCVDIDEHKFEGSGKTKKEARMSAADKAVEFLLQHPEHIQKPSHSTATTSATTTTTTTTSAAAAAQKSSTSPSADVTVATTPKSDGVERGGEGEKEPNDNESGCGEGDDDDDDVNESSAEGVEGDEVAPALDEDDDDGGADEEETAGSGDSDVSPAATTKRFKHSDD